MFQFEKLLKQNNIDENDPELERVIVKQIKQFRKLQSSITSETTSEERDEIENKMDALDESIMQTLPEFFEIEDEAEIKKQQKIAETAKKEEEKRIADQKAAEQAAKEKAKTDAEQAELNTPATNDDDALDKLFRKGKTKVSVTDLRHAGFNTGFFGDLTPSGCVTKRYKLICNDGSEQYQLIKK